MKKIISILAISLFAISYAQETPKAGCCAGKDKKECSMKDKKACGDNHKDCSSKAKTAENATKTDKKEQKAKKAA